MLLQQLKRTYLCIQIQLWKAFVWDQHSAEKKPFLFFVLVALFSRAISAINRCNLYLPLSFVFASCAFQPFRRPAFQLFFRSCFFALPKRRVFTTFLLEREGEHWYVNGRLGYFCSWRTVDCWDIFENF